MSLMDNREQREAMSEAAASDARARFDRDSMIEAALLVHGAGDALGRLPRLSRAPRKAEQ